MDIEAYRLRKKKTVAELAEMLGVKEAAIYNYKYKKSKPSYESIEKMLLDGAFICEVFDTELPLEIHGTPIGNPRNSHWKSTELHWKSQPHPHYITFHFISFHYRIITIILI